MVPQVMHTGAFIDTTRSRPEDAHTSLENMSKGQTWMVLAQQHIQHVEAQLEDSRQKADRFSTAGPPPRLAFSAGRHRSSARTPTSQQPTNPDPWRVFRHEWFGLVRTLWREGELCFVAIDVARALGYQNPTQAVRLHCKGTLETSVPSLGGRQLTNIIRLADVVRLVMRSQLPDAEEFQDWVCDDMIPQVMHTGTFIDTTRNRPGDAHASLENLSKGQAWMLLGQQHIEHIEAQLEDSRQKAGRFDQLMDIPAMRECATLRDLMNHIPRMSRESQLREAMIEDGYLYRDRSTGRVRIYAEMRKGDHPG